MAKNPTIAQLIAKAIELNSTLTEETAKQLIKAADAKSYKKVAEAVEAAKAAEEKKSKKKPEAKTKEPKVIQIVQPGPRGFQFGYTYVQSVIDASRIAMKEANKGKLVAFATLLGLTEITMASDIAESIKAMKKAATKYLAENFEAPAEAA